MVSKTFLEKYSGYSIEFDVEGNVATTKAINCDFKNIIAFVSLLRDCITLKKQGVQYIAMVIPQSDIDSIAGSTWCPRVNNGMVHIICDIDDYLKNMDICLGLTKV